MNDTRDQLALWVCRKSHPLHALVPCDAARASADDLLASGVLDQLRADAWDEGWYDASGISCGCLGDGRDRNPYRS